VYTNQVRHHTHLAHNSLPGNATLSELYTRPSVKIWVISSIFDNFQQFPAFKRLDNFTCGKQTRHMLSFTAGAYDSEQDPLLLLPCLLDCSDDNFHKASWTLIEQIMDEVSECSLPSVQFGEKNDQWPKKNL